MHDAHIRIPSGQIGLMLRFAWENELGGYRNPATASARSVTIVYPDGTKVTRAGDDTTVVTNSEGNPALQYKTRTTEQTAVGFYRAQAHMTDADGTYPSEIVMWEVYASL